MTAPAPCCLKHEALRDMVAKNPKCPICGRSYGHLKLCLGKLALAEPCDPKEKKG